MHTMEAHRHTLTHAHTHKLAGGFEIMHIHYRPLSSSSSNKGLFDRHLIKIV